MRRSRFLLQGFMVALVASALLACAPQGAVVKPAIPESRPAAPTPTAPRGAAAEADCASRPAGTPGCAPLPDAARRAAAAARAVPQTASGKASPSAARRGVRVPARVVLEGVNFPPGETALLPEAAAILDRVVPTLKQWGDVRIEVAGHTDAVGNDLKNMRLSRRRAEVVRRYLVDQGIPAARLRAVGYGESSPVADNDTPENRARNRRVELIPRL